MEVTIDTLSPLFSIIVANYNNGRFLSECIESIRQQTYNNWEIILVDDASTDYSNELYNAYKNDVRIKIFHNQTNKGVGYTKRKAVENSNGKYCGVVDPDDKIIPETIELVVNQFEQNPSAAIVHTNHYICDENLDIIKTAATTGQIPMGESQLSYEGPNIGPFWAFKRSLYDQTSGIDINLKCAEDQDIYYKLEEFGNIIYINKTCYYYRYHDGGISTTNNMLNALYWNLIATTNAHKRRLKQKSSTPNISKKQINKRWLSYYQSLTIKMYRNNENTNALYAILKSFKYIWYDSKLLSIRILIRYLIFKKELIK